jgi:hypothetical protein
VIGIDRAIRDALSAELGVSQAIVGLALAEHVGRRAYQAALAAPGAMRDGLDGAPQGDGGAGGAGGREAGAASRPGSTAGTIRLQGGAQRPVAASATGRKLTIR